MSASQGPVQKYNFLVKDVNDLSRTVKEAFYIASTGRPGPVLIDLPKDVTTCKADFTWPELDMRSYKPTYEGNKWMITQAANLMAKSKKPIIIARRRGDHIRRCKRIKRTGGTYRYTGYYDINGAWRFSGLS